MKYSNQLFTDKTVEVSSEFVKCEGTENKWVCLHNVQHYVLVLLENVDNEEGGQCLTTFFFLECKLLI